ncbi:MAG: ankyrin repeat domain-containing protein [Myxococcales bacterium FL481]|nr:MAG: ankyrin repeat domain-containing protein [Myxococcales bacterium FL481]
MSGAMLGDDSRHLTMTRIRTALETGDTSIFHHDIWSQRRDDLDLSAPLDERGRTLLMQASQSGQAAFARALVELGASVHQRDVSGYTALLLARDCDTATVLLEAGARVNEAANNGVTALAIAAQRGELRLARLFLSIGADVDAPSRHGSTPVMRAAERGHMHIVDLLLDAGADPFRRDRWGRTANDHLPGSMRSAA